MTLRIELSRPAISLSENELQEALRRLEDMKVHLSNELNRRRKPDTPKWGFLLPYSSDYATFDSMNEALAAVCEAYPHVDSETCYYKVIRVYA